MYLCSLRVYIVFIWPLYGAYMVRIQRYIFGILLVFCWNYVGARGHREARLRLGVATGRSGGKPLWWARISPVAASAWPRADLLVWSSPQRNAAWVLGRVPSYQGLRG
jgi:hypothetical protein